MFTDSLAKLTGEEQKRAKTTAFDLQLNPKNQGLNFHRLNRIKGKDRVAGSRWGPACRCEG